MGLEQGSPLPPPPEEIIVETPELKVNSEGKRYAQEESGVFYGGDYLDKPPAEINIDLPPPPEVPPHPAI